MKVTLIVAISLDGKITKGDAPGSSWTSKEDREFFHVIRDKHNLIVMGRGVYDVIKDKMKLDKSKLRVVLTRHPEKHKAEEIPDQLEFTNNEPRRFIQLMIERGYKEMLLVSGAAVTTEFFKANLVDEIYITIEPMIFGAGKGLVNAEELGIQLQLLSSKKLNGQGTMLLHYQVVK